MDKLIEWLVLGVMAISVPGGSAYQPTVKSETTNKNYGHDVVVTVETGYEPFLPYRRPKGALNAIQEIVWDKDQTNLIHQASFHTDGNPATPSGGFETIAEAYAAIKNASSYRQATCPTFDPMYWGPEGGQTNESYYIRIEYFADENCTGDPDVVNETITPKCNEPGDPPSDDMDHDLGDWCVKTNPRPVAVDTKGVRMELGTTWDADDYPRPFMDETMGGECATGWPLTTAQWADINGTKIPALTTTATVGYMWFHKTGQLLRVSTGTPKRVNGVCTWDSDEDFWGDEHSGTNLPDRYRMVR